MSELLQFFKDMRDNGYGLAEIAAQLGTSAIAEPVAGFAAMYDPEHGADAIREGMTYQPRSQAAQEYSQSVGNAAKTAIKPAMPIIDAWKQGVDIAGRYSPAAGAALQTVPTALGALMGYKPAMQTGRQVSEGLGAMQGRMIANANAPRTLNTGYMGQRGAIGLTNDFDNSDEIKIIADYLGQSPESMLVNRDLYTKKQGAINSLVSRYEQMDDFSGAYYPTSYGYISISPSAKSNGQWQLTSFDKKMNPLSDQGEMSKNKALTEFFKTIKPNKYGNITPVQTTPKRPLTEFEKAHLLAQQRAALPVEKGGLGLPADNTAMDRARAMGFDVDNGVYHGTNADIESFNTSGKGKTTGSGAFFTDNPSVASTYSDSRNGVLYPILLNNGKVVNVAADGANWNWLKKNIKITSEKTKDRKALNKNLGKLFAEDFKYNDALTTDDLASWANNENYDAIKFNQVKDRGPQGVFANQESSLPSNNTAVFDPKNIRSRFAAFDPFNRESSNLLATTAPLVPTTALGAYMYNENRKNTKGNQ